VPGRIPHKTPADRVAAICQLRLTAADIAERLSMPCSTVSAVLAREGLGKRSRLARPEPPNRYEREAPGELIHIDVNKLGRIGRVGKRITGHVAGGACTPAGLGWEAMHVAVDGFSRLAYVEVLADGVYLLPPVKQPDESPPASAGLSSGSRAVGPGRFGRDQNGRHGRSGATRGNRAMVEAGAVTAPRGQSGRRPIGRSTAARMVASSPTTTRRRRTRVMLVGAARREIRDRGSGRRTAAADNGLSASRARGSGTRAIGSRRVRPDAGQAGRTYEATTPVVARLQPERGGSHSASERDHDGDLRLVAG
jgi:hypothetical protein